MKYLLTVLLLAPCVVLAQEYIPEVSPPEKGISDAAPLMAILPRAVERTSTHETPVSITNVEQNAYSTRVNWSHHPNATEYQVTQTDDGGTVVYSETTTATQIDLPSGDDTDITVRAITPLGLSQSAEVRTSKNRNRYVE